MARLALAIAYDGTRFDSYARQPGHRTVEGELLALLSRAGVLEDASAARFRSGSRTDAGVSAAWNVVAFDSQLPAGAVVAQTTKAPEGLHLLSAVQVPPGFEPRHARRRTYRYLLEAPWDWKRVGPVARLFVGDHDFSNFRRADGDKPPAGRVDRVAHRSTAPGPWFEVSAPSFLWQQIRRMVSALQAVQDRRLTTADVKAALEDPKRRVDLGLASAESLLLMDVEYANVKFSAMQRSAMNRLEAARASARRRSAWLDAIQA